MKNIYSDSAAVEKKAKETYEIPDFLMMENASISIKNLILSLCKNTASEPQVFIFCGKGNNGGDGLALARMLDGVCPLFIYCPVEPVASEALAQYKMCRNLQLPFLSKEEFLFNLTQSSKKSSENTFIIDCLYGTGFKGQLNEDIASFINEINSTEGIKIACDISSGLEFKADYTVTMGTLKLQLFSDKAKAVSGQISVSDLGIFNKKFENTLYGQLITTEKDKIIQPSAFLIEKTDIKLPFRTNPSAHKGTYGHTNVFAGEKAGAGIIAATAALNFGSGLTSLIKTEKSNLEQFKISPELMINTEIPAKTTAILIGSGLGELNDDIIKKIKNWAATAKNPGIVMDSDIFSSNKFIEFLSDLNKFSGIKIILTPHLLEFSRILKQIHEIYPEELKKYSDNDNDFLSVKNLADNCEFKIAAGKIINEKFPQTTVIIKSANTFIASEKQIYICNEGTQSLAKGGSGDVLAGMTAALLAQGYSSKEASITAVMAHAMASKVNSDGQQYNLSPEKIIENLGRI